MSDYIDDVFGSNGLLARRFAGYTPRVGQVALSRAVDAAMRDGEHLVAEAPTGTGKSLAYAVPATYHAAQEGLRVVIATANIALQEQLVDKDLPLLTSILPWKFEYTLLKGRSNYLCLDRLLNGAPATLHQHDEGRNREILEWADRTECGDVSELPFEPGARLWSRFSVSSDDCLGSDCEHAAQCFANAAQRRAIDAHVVVVNYHLLFADMQVRDMTGDAAFVLPRYDVAILDEGHRAVEIARDFFGSRITERSVEWAAKMLDPEVRDPLNRAASDFFAALREHRRSPSYRARLRAPNAVEWASLDAALLKAIGRYGHMIANLEGSAGEGGDPADRKTLRRLKGKWRRVCELRGHITAAMTLPRKDPPVVHFIEEERDNVTVALCSKPLSVSQRLHEDLFDQTLSVTVTSATLTARGSFDYVVGDLGVTEPATLRAESPFRWGDQVLLVTPSGLPDPTKDKRRHGELVTETCSRVIELAEGRTLGLFTSHRALDEAYERALRTGYRILKQGDMPRSKLIAEFRDDVRSVLLGTESFWAGVDVPGESLSCVFIDRLPFTPPDDPILDAMQELDRECFMKVSVPKAIIAFKQGFGRLIRTVADRGVVVLMDGRVVTKFYGRMFLESLPPTARSVDLEDVGNFLRGEPLRNLSSVKTENDKDSRSLLDL